MEKKEVKLADQIEVVEKDFNIPVPTTFSSPSAPPTSVVATPNVSPSSIMYWPAPKMWYQQGKEAAKKAYNEYLNATNQYLQAPPDQFERQMEMAGKMNSIVQSMVQGISLGTESLEDISRRVRTGDQAALIEQAVVSDIIMRMLKTVWVHNVAAKSGRNAGLEVKLLENQLVGRINRSANLNASDEGIALQSNDDADTIWVEDINQAVPPEEVMGEGGGEEVPPEEMVGEEVPPEEGAEEEIPPEEAMVEGEEIPPEEAMVEGEEVPVDESEMSDEELQQLLAEIEGEGGEEIPPEEAMVEGEEVPPEEIVDEEIPPEELAGEEVPPEEVIEEEVSPEEGTEEEVPPEEITGEEVPPEEAAAEGEVPPEEAAEEETPPEEGAVEEVPPEEGAEEEDTFYCPVCDKYVTMSEAESCEEDSCPFAYLKTEEDGGASSEEEEGASPEESPSSEESKKKTEKHYVIVDADDHSECNVSRFTVKDFTGVKGEFCVNHGKAISYEFEQDQWASEDAKAWVNKQTRINKVKTKSSEKIIEKTVDDIPPDVIKKWVDEQNIKRNTLSVTDNELDIDEGELKDLLSTTITKAVSQFENRLNSLEGTFLKT